MIKDYIQTTLLFGMALTGAAFLIGTIAGLTIQGSFYASAERTEGRLVEMVQGGEGDLFYPRFTFVDHAGEQRTVTSSFGQHPFPYEANETVPVVYDPENPERAKIDTFFQVWGFSALIMIISGTMFIMCGAGYFVFQKFVQDKSGEGTA